MSQRGKPYAHHWNPNGGNYASPIHEAAAHPFGAFALGWLTKKCIRIGPVIGKQA